MLIGSGLLAKAFAPTFSGREDVCIYAAGVSNSSCTDKQEFERERKRLTHALHQASKVDAFVYFGTCSVADPEAQDTPYVQHKLAMEQLVSAHPKYLIFRLPQVAGRTPNPHTLLNFLYARVSRSESFTLWSKARRNIIDVDDVAAISCQLISDHTFRQATANIANPTSYAMLDIVAAMEKAVGKRAVYEVFERGSWYQIDIRAILPVIDAAGVKFDKDYLERVIGKYYGK
jgi:nucleoside-diphosphate-sugar epimerase